VTLQNPEGPADHSDSDPRIVVGVDGSPCSHRALAFAVDEAVQRQARLEVVGVYATPSTVGWVDVVPEPLAQPVTTSVDDAVTVARTRAPALRIDGKVCHGSAGRVLVKRSDGAALLVVGSHGRSPLNRVLLGSVSEFCARHASCPTVIVR
jgi:nucleotide-binding universal stress UspA family protein